MSERNVNIDSRGFLRIDGIKVCRVTDEGLLEFKDKDGRRSRTRGSAYVTVYADQISQAVENVTHTEKSKGGTNGTGKPG